MKAWCRYHGTVISRVRKHSEARAIVAWLMRKFGRESLTAIASYFNRDVATMSTAVRKLERRLRKDDEIKEKLDEIQENIKLWPALFHRL